MSAADQDWHLQPLSGKDCDLDWPIFRDRIMDLKSSIWAAVKSTVLMDSDVIIFTCAPSAATPGSLQLISSPASEKAADLMIVFLLLWEDKQVLLNLTKWHLCQNFLTTWTL